MPVPANVIEMLESNKIAYQLRASHARICHSRLALEATANVTEDSCLVKSLVLCDHQGRVQVLLPANRMLDLASIETQFGRALERLPQPEMNSLLGDQDVIAVPAIPSWQGMTTLVDASLLSHPVLWLETGDHSQLLEVQQADFQSIIRSACVGQLSVVAPRVPTNAEADKQQISHSIKTFTQLRIKQRLEETLELPPLPDTAQKIIRLRANPDADISDLSNIVELDSSLAAQVVSWASSPYYSAPGKIRSIHDAIVRVLGFDMVLNLALGLALGKSFNAQAMSSAQLKDYWRNAVCVAATVEGLVTSIAREHRPSFGMAYLSGLLYNFGQFILAEVFPPYYNNVRRHCDVNPHLPEASIEQQLIGVSSCQITAWLMKTWTMPEEVLVAIRHQNNPAYKGDHDIYPKLVYVAKQLLANHGFGGRCYRELPANLLDELRLDRETADVTVSNILESADDLHAIADLIQN